MTTATNYNHLTNFCFVKNTNYYIVDLIRWILLLGDALLYISEISFNIEALTTMEFKIEVNSVKKFCQDLLDV